MFSKKLSADAFSNLVAEGSIVDGKVRFTGIIKIQGTVNGDVIRSIVDANAKKPDDCIIVDTCGEVTSDEMTATSMILAGKITSKTITADGTLRVLKTANISGAVIYYRTLEMEPGAVLHECQLKHLDRAAETPNV